ncbi:MAG: phage terminase large subunit [Gordonibacter sp.]|uniref:PBSX family phage terminase large subunit n=1 Tax=Gordonibacter sp. TaxID=1968902 RepID=UPI002FCA28F4
MTQRITQNQELYCQARLRGLTQRAAYREAYPRSLQWRDDSVDNAASAIERNPQVSARLEELNKASAKRASIKRSKLLNRLDSLADKADKRLINNADDINTLNADILIKATKELLPYAEDEAANDQAFTVDFGLLIAPPFLRPHRYINDKAMRDLWVRGGRGSTKSSWASLEVVNYIERNHDQHALVLMKHKNNLRDAAYAQIVWAIETLGLEEEYDMPPSTFRIRKRSTGQLIIFRGCDDASKIKSIKVPFGYIGIVWFEEADQFSGMAEIRKVRQSATRGGEDAVRIYTYNPPRSKNCWINEYVQQRIDGGKEAFESTFLDVPKEWLGDHFIADAEELANDDHQSYEHEYLGLPVGMGGDVFDRAVFREIEDAEIAAFDNIHAGQDFGWYPDPWAYTMSEWQPGQRTVLTYRELGGNKVQPPAAANLIHDALTWSDDPGAAPEYHHIKVASDDAAPEQISAQRDAGVNARAAGKGNKRMASYVWLASVKWVIDPARCPKLAAEVRRKQYDRNKDGEWLNVIPDGDDHYIDATRYAFMDIVSRARSAYRATPEEE